MTSDESRIPPVLKRVARGLLPAKVIEALATYYLTPACVRNSRLWGLRRALKPYFLLPCWIVSSEGARFFLGKDPIDDIILEDLLIHCQRVYFPEELSALSPAMLVLDIGAHHGLFATAMLCRHRYAKVIAVEPNPAATRFIRKNLCGNYLLRRAEITQAGIAPREDAIFLHLSKRGSWADTTSSAMDEVGESSGRTVVRGTTVASILKGRVPDVVKCNAEGAEFEVFRQLFAMGILPQIVILMAHEQFGRVKDLLDLFYDRGYNIRRLPTGTEGQPHYHCIRQT